MKTLQNCVLLNKPMRTADGTFVWSFKFDDDSVIAVREANVVTGPGFVYRAGRNGTLTPLKSTIRKNRDNLYLVAKNFPEVGKIDNAKSIYYGFVGWDYNEDHPIGYGLLKQLIGEI